jgi:nicotinamidase-related amidase
MNPVQNHRKQISLLVIDVQERLMPVIYEKETVIRNINTLIRGAEILGIQTIFTEQYPKGLGNTCSDIVIPPYAVVHEKNSFSCMLNEGIDRSLKLHSTTEIILCGAESHICVLKTALDAIKEGYTVHVVADAVSSRTTANKTIALERMKQGGAFLVSVEMILFMMIDQAGTKEFKSISNLIK